jgi:hypothetical protein
LSNSSSELIGWCDRSTRRRRSAINKCLDGLIVCGGIAAHFFLIFKEETLLFI